MKKSIKIIPFLLLLFMSKLGFSQDTYRTHDGDIEIMIVSADSILKITSKQLVVILNYSTATIEIRMDKSTFYTGIDSLDRKLKLMKYEVIEFNGKLDIDNINTNGHPPLDFGVEGILSTNNQIVKGSGHLEHISNRGNFSCLLTLKFNLKTSSLGLNLDGLKLGDDVEIQVVQMILNRASDY